MAGAEDALASEPSHKRKRVAIDHAAARRARNDAQPLGRPPEEPRLAPAGRARGTDGASDRMRGAGQRAHAGAAPRRTRLPYAEHGMPVRQRPDRAATTQHARLAQGRQGRRAVPFYDEPPRAARGRQQQPEQHLSQSAQPAPPFSAPQHLLFPAPKFLIAPLFCTLTPFLLFHIPLSAALPISFRFIFFLVLLWSSFPIFLFRPSVSSFRKTVHRNQISLIPYFR